MKITVRSSNVSAISHSMHSYSCPFLSHTDKSFLRLFAYWRRVRNHYYRDQAALSWLNGAANVGPHRVPQRRY